MVDLTCSHKSFRGYVEGERQDRLPLEALGQGGTMEMRMQNIRIQNQ